MLGKRFFIVLLIAALAAPALTILPSAGAQEGEQPRTGIRPDAPPYGVRGPYAVGTREFVIDEGSERPLPGTVWYPAVKPEGVEEATTYIMPLTDMVPPELYTYEGKAIRDAAPDTSGAPYPLVVFATGGEAQRFYSFFILEHLASYGFVVTVIEHPGSSLRDKLLATTEEQQAALTESMVMELVTRPADVRHEIDYVETLTAAGGGLEGVIDMDRVAVVGRGEPTLALAGAQLNPSFFRDHYAEYPNPYLDAVDYTKWLDLLLPKLASAAGLDTVPEGLWPPFSDPRIDVVAAILPATYTLFGPEGLRNITIPTMVTYGDADQLLNSEDMALIYPNLASTTRSEVVFENGSCALGGTCPPAWLAIDVTDCADPVWDLDRAHDLIDHFVTAFLLAELYGDTDAAAALAPDAVSFTGIEYQAMGF